MWSQVQFLPLPFFRTGCSVLLEKVKNFAISNKWLIIPFLIFLILQIYQAAFPSWDSITYIFQGKWFCGQEIYFEWLRPPLPGATMCLLGATELSYILSAAAASILYFIGAYMVFRDSGVKNQFVFGAFAFLFPTILFYSNFGSDLFAIAFLLIAVGLKSPFSKGLAFGLATLSRYNFLLYFIIFLPQLELKPKKILEFLAGLVLTWIPWVVYNYLATGNAFFSVEESLVLNVFQKGTLAMPGPMQIFFMLFFLALFFATGFSRNLKSAPNQLGLLALVQFFVSGIKENRFLAPLAIAQAQNAAGEKNPLLGKIFHGAAILLFLHAIVGGYFIYTYSPQLPQEDSLRACRVYSDDWVYFYRQGIVAEPLPGPEEFEKKIEGGSKIVLFHTPVPREFEKYVLSSSEKYKILGNDACELQLKSYELKVWRG